MSGNNDDHEQTAGQLTLKVNEVHDDFRNGISDRDYSSLKVRPAIPRSPGSGYNSIFNFLFLMGRAGGRSRKPMSDPSSPIKGLMLLDTTILPFAYQTQRGKPIIHGPGVEVACSLDVSCRFPPCARKDPVHVMIAQGCRSTENGTAVRVRAEEETIGRCWIAGSIR